MKTYHKIIIFISISISITYGAVYAASSVDYFQIMSFITSSPVRTYAEYQIDKHSVCKRVRTSASESYFLPIKTALEWSQFRSSVDSIDNIDLEDCLSNTVTFSILSNPISSDANKVYYPADNYFLHGIHNTSANRTQYCNDQGFSNVVSYNSISYTSPGDDQVAIFVSGSPAEPEGSWEYVNAGTLSNNHFDEITCSGRFLERQRVNTGPDSLLTSLGADEYYGGLTGHSPRTYIGPRGGTQFDITRPQIDTSDWSQDTAIQYCVEIGYPRLADHANQPTATDNRSFIVTSLDADMSDPNLPIWDNTIFAIYDSGIWTTATNTTNQLSLHNHGLQNHVSRESYIIRLSSFVCERDL